MICKELGYEKAANTSNAKTFEHARGNHAFTKISCMGTEKSITDCKIEPIENCASLHGAAVVCENKLQLKGDFYFSALSDQKQNSVFISNRNLIPSPPLLHLSCVQKWNVTPLLGHF